MQKPLLIMGIDPGTTLGYALIDLNGHLVHIESSKELDLSLLLATAVRWGRIILVGCDKQPTPAFVEKFSTKIGARLVCPKHDLKVADKKRMTYGQNFHNIHEMDALAAALLAYKEYRPLFQKIEAYLSKKGKQDDRELYYRMVERLLKGGMNIHEAHQDIEQQEPEIKQIKKARVTMTPEIPSADPKIDPKISNLVERIKRLKKENKLMSHQHKILTQRIQKFLKQRKQEQTENIQKIPEEKVKQLLYHKEKNIYHLEHDLEEREQEIKKLQQRLVMITDLLTHLPQYSLVKRMRSLGLREYTHAVEKLSLSQGDIVVVKDASIVSREVLERLEGVITIILYEERISREVQQRFTAIPLNGLSIIPFNGLAFISKKELDERMRNHRLGKNMVRDIVQQYQKERQEESNKKEKKLSLA